MDIQMPDMDGIRACELIHHLPHHQLTPVIAVTAHALEGQREKLLSAGMNDYLAKPIEEEKLHALLLRYQPGVHSIAPAAIPPTEPVIDHNQTLDWQLALRQAAMKPDLAREMLQMLIAFMPEVRNKVEEQLVGEQPEGLVDLIHKLHGSCSYSGVPRLKKLCHTLESQLRAGTAAEDLEPELLELLDEIAVLRTLSGLQIPLRQPGSLNYSLPPICKTAATFRAVIRRLAAALASASSRVQMVYNTLNTASSPC